MMNKTKRFDDHQKKFYDEERLMKRSAELAAHNVGSAKRHAHRAALAFIEMQRSGANRLMQIIREAVGPGDAPVNRFIEQTFAPIAFIDEGFEELVTAVYEGMTEDDYLKQSPTCFVGSKRARSRSQLAKPGEVLPSKPMDDMTIEEQAGHWRTRALAAEQDIRTLKTQVNELSREARKLRGQNKKLHRLVMAAAL